MKKITKNLLLGMGTLTSVISPVVAVVACGNNPSNKGLGFPSEVSVQGSRANLLSEINVSGVKGVVYKMQDEHEVFQNAFIDTSSISSLESLSDALYSTIENNKEIKDYVSLDKSFFPVNFISNINIIKQFITGNFSKDQQSENPEMVVWHMTENSLFLKYLGTHSKTDFFEMVKIVFAEMKKSANGDENISTFRNPGDTGRLFEELNHDAFKQFAARINL